MATNVERFKTDLKKLVELGSEMKLDLTVRAQKEAGVLDPKHKAAAETLEGSLERHLAQVASNHGLASRKKDPSISDFNDMLKSDSVIDTAVWR